MRHVIVYRKPDRWAATPANYGIWSWGDEIVVGFVAGLLQPSGEFHARDRSQPMTAMQARSLDGGLTWQTTPIPARAPGGRCFSADEHVVPELGVGHALAAGLPPQLGPWPDGLDFTHPDFALLAARTGLGAGTVAWCYVSTDRCRSWQGPLRLPSFGLPGIEARTDYLVLGPRRLLLFLTAARASGSEGGGVFCARTADGGATFELVSWVACADEGFVIMPASVRLPDGRLLTAVRCRDSAAPTARNWIDLYTSQDQGATWRFLSRPVADTGQGGNPPTLTRLHDGRLCITHGYRNAPYGIRATLSEDEGATWGPVIVLRDDAGNADIGYPRTVQRPDGTIVTVYWLNDHAEGERYIAATLWQP
ncbi:MAG: exo-alpha-sialidase [Anaerolineales bacterium]|nr:exo-alpha-sialidase [Anaerolineales bacterium]